MESACAVYYFLFSPRSLFPFCEMFYLNGRVGVEIKLTLSLTFSLSLRLGDLLKQNYSYNFPLDAIKSSQGTVKEAKNAEQVF